MFFSKYNMLSSRRENLFVVCYYDEMVIMMWNVRECGWYDIPIGFRVFLSLFYQKIYQRLDAIIAKEIWFAEAQKLSCRAKNLFSDIDI